VYCLYKRGKRLSNHRWDAGGRKSRDRGQVCFARRHWLGLMGGVIGCHDDASQAMKFDGTTCKAEVEKERCVGCLLCKPIWPVWYCISTEETDAPITGGQHADALTFVQQD